MQGPVKPLLLVVERRVVVVIEDVVEPFLPPANKGALSDTLEGHMPDSEARLTV
jgi:hypothetical protein